jgi:parallel beta-helix repeat protein
MKNGVVLRSSAGPDSTFLDGPSLSEKPLDERLLECLAGVGPSTVIEGFQMRSGAVRGAAIYCEGASPTIRGNVIRDWGWGINLRDSSNAVVEDNLIDGCKAFGISVFASSPIIRRNTLSNNDPRAISIGGRKSHPIIGGHKQDANRIFGSRYAIFNESRNDIVATWNDWGWATTTEMERYPYPTDVSVIQDGNDRGDTHRGRGKVDYRHWILPTKAEAATRPATRAATDTAAVVDTTGAAAPVLATPSGTTAEPVPAAGAATAAPKARWPWLVAGAIVLLLLVMLTRGRRTSAGA